MGIGVTEACFSFSRPWSNEGNKSSEKKVEVQYNVEGSRKQPAHEVDEVPMAIGSPKFHEVLD